MGQYLSTPEIPQVQKSEVQKSEEVIKSSEKQECYDGVSTISNPNPISLPRGEQGLSTTSNPWPISLLCDEDLVITNPPRTKYNNVTPSISEPDDIESETKKREMWEQRTNAPYKDLVANKKRFQLTPEAKALLVSAVVEAQASNEAEMLKKEQQSKVLLTVAFDAMKQNVNHMSLKIDELTLENCLLRKRLEEYKQLYYQTSKQIFKCQ
jgi:hypothetical protein